MSSIPGKFGVVGMTLYAVAFFGFATIANASEINEANSPSSDLSWEQAEQMINDWVEKNWHEEVIEDKQNLAQFDAHPPKGDNRPKGE